MNNPKSVAVLRDPAGILIGGSTVALYLSVQLEFLRTLGGYWGLEVEYERIEDEYCALFYFPPTKEKGV